MKDRDMQEPMYSLGKDARPSRVKQKPWKAVLCAGRDGRWLVSVWGRLGRAQGPSWWSWAGSRTPRARGEALPAANAFDTQNPHHLHLSEGSLLGPCTGCQAGRKREEVAGTQWKVDLKCGSV